MTLHKINLLQQLPSQYLWHAVGGLLAFFVISGAAFFHLFTPLGIEVIHQGASDHGSLFYAATSIVLLGWFLFVIKMRKYQAHLTTTNLSTLNLTIPNLTKEI